MAQNSSEQSAGLSPATDNVLQISLPCLDVSEFEQDFSSEPTRDAERLRDYVRFLGLTGDMPHCLTSSTPDSEAVLFFEPTILGNPYHKRVRAVETEYNKSARSVWCRDMLIDITELKIVMLELPLFKNEDFTAERAPCLSFLGEGNSLVISQGKMYQRMFSNALESGLTKAPADDFSAAAILGKYTKGEMYNVISDTSFSGSDDVLQARNLILAA